MARDRRGGLQAGHALSMELSMSNRSAARPGTGRHLCEGAALPFLAMHVIRNPRRNATVHHRLVLTVIGSALTLLLAVAAAQPAGAVSADAPHPAVSASLQPVVQPLAGTAFPADAPDPDVVRVGSTYYAYTTGTTWGNHLGVLIDTSGSPASGWRTITGAPYGSSALPDPPTWEQVNTQTSPGVIELGSTWFLYYDAYDPALGQTCLSVATATNPTGPFTDTSSGPFECQVPLGGSVDPSPFVDPATGAAWLQWKSNNGTVDTSAQLWSAPLAANGLGLAAAPSLLLTQNEVAHPWETTVENPDMVVIHGIYVLFFSGGAWSSAGYAESYAICAGVTGPCSQPTEGPLLSSTTTYFGPGGGSTFTDPSGALWMVFAAWNVSCASYAAPCSGARELHMATVRSIITGGTSNAPVLALAPTTSGAGYHEVASDGGIFSFGDAQFYGSMGGHPLNKPVVGMAAVPGGGGYWEVASDGGIFSFGDAQFYGSMGGHPLNKPVVGMAAVPGAGGYWEVASDGGIFAFGNAQFYGSTGGTVLDQTVVGMAAVPGGGGYWLVGSAGGVYAFGDAGNDGSASS